MTFLPLAHAPSGELRMPSESNVLSFVSSRVSSAFFFSFIASWLAWNHRLLFVLFSGMPVQERFSYIDNELYSSLQTIWGVGLSYPLLTATAYVLLGPLIDRWVEIWRLRVRRKMREDEARSEGLELMTRETSEAARADIRKLREKVSQLQSKNEELHASNCLRKLMLSHERKTDTVNADTKSLLMACNFGSEVNAVGGTEGQVEFLEDGAAQGFIFGLGHVNRWRLESGHLELGSLRDDESWHEFRFDSSTGKFVGPKTDMDRSLMLLPLVKMR